MKRDIEKFLIDLYQLDASLKKHEKELVELIHQMLESRPDTKFDDKFAQELRAQLINKAQILAKKPERNNLIYNFNPMKKIIYAISGATACVILLAIVYYPLSQKNQNINLGFGDLRISALPAGSFGELSLQSQASSQSEHFSVDGRGAGGGGNATVSSKPYIGIPIFKNYKYVYTGDEFEIEAGEGLVYKYQPAVDASEKLAKLFKGTNFGLVDINGFSNLGLNNLTFAENKEFGYMISVDLNNTNIYIGQNWTKWPQEDMMSGCAGDEECLKLAQLSEDDVLSNEELISLADNFINQYGISRSNYGDPIVHEEWRLYYERDKANGYGYIPENMQVTYPLMIDGQAVYDQSGSPVGLSVSINIRYQKVTGVYGLRAENYQSAVYPLIADSNEIIKMAEAGGAYPAYQEDGAETMEIKLGNPRISLIKVYNYDNFTQEEMLVPGLIFPVQDAPEDYYGQSKITVLLVSGLTNNSEPILFR